MSQADAVGFSRARRKAAELHPETGHGKASPSKDPKSGSFIDATSEQTGRSRSSVAQDARRGARIAPDVLEAIQGTGRRRKTKIATCDLSLKRRQTQPTSTVPVEAAWRKTSAQSLRPRSPGSPHLTNRTLEAYHEPADTFVGV